MYKRAKKIKINCILAFMMRFSSISSLCTILLVFCVLSLKSQSLNVQFDYCQFISEDNRPYIETYLSIDGKSTVFKELRNGEYQSEVEIEFIFTNSKKEIKKVDKYNLLSPLIEDTNNIDFVFIDLQRYTLEIDSYLFDIKIKDANNELSKIKYQQELKIEKQNGLSDIQLIADFKESVQKNILSKNGYDLTPFVSNFYNSSNHFLNYYFEYYDNTKKVVLRTSIVSNDTKKAVNDLFRTKRSEKTKTVVLSSFPIKDIPSSTYSLVVEVIDENNQVIEKKERVIFKQGYDLDTEIVNVENTFASRINNLDTLKKYIQYLYPIESPKESLYSINQLKYDSLEFMQKYFYQFWKKRDVFNPELAWLKYLQKVKTVNSKFNNGFIKGFLTDRGRIFLSHGAPNSRMEEYKPRQFDPFEVWHYYELGSERNVKFIFSEVTPNQFRLVYSNKEGETSDQDWSNKFNENYYDNNNDGNSPWDYFNNPK